MKKILLIIIAPLLLFSQEETDTISSKNNWNHKIEWNTNILFETNGLNKKFLNSFLQGGYIENSTKEEWMQISKDKNVIYSELKNSLSYTNMKYNIGFNVADRNTINIAFSKNLMGLALYGNANYQDRNIDISNTNIRINRFQQYKLNYHHKINKFKYIKDLKIDMGFGISYLIGNYHTSYIIKEGSIYTAPFGAMLDINYDMNAIVSDTSNIGVFGNNGNGIAFDIGINFSLKDYQVELYMQDIGSIEWNESSIIYNTDSNFTFTGVEVESILNFNDSILDEYNSDEYFTSNINKMKSYIPGRFGFSISKNNFYKKLEIIKAGVNFNWQPYFYNDAESFSNLLSRGIKESNYQPLMWLSTNTNLKYIYLNNTISYGGYSENINIGLEIERRGKNSKFILGTTHMEDLINGENQSAISVYLQIQTKF
tara:strand:- start:987 stop:2267 length:1281 start_codon:yes stop_codon:yes gene_type:complete